MKDPTPLAEATDQRTEETPDRRENVVDRRLGLDRRQTPAAESGYTGPERRVRDRERRADDTGLERRRGPGRRLSDERRSAEEGEMTPEQFEFVMAIQTYKKVNKKMYPTWTEVLEVMKQLGYRKVHHRELALPNIPEPELVQLGSD
jgi:IS5 family transposase